MAEAALENSWQRELDQDRQAQLAEQTAGISDTIQKVRDVKKAADTLKTVKIAFGVSLVLAIVTYVIWSLQFVFGNLMGLDFMPELEGAELYLFWVISFFLVSTLIILIMVVMAILNNPWAQAVIKTVEVIGYYP